MNCLMFNHVLKIREKNSIKEVLEECVFLFIWNVGSVTEELKQVTSARTCLFLTKWLTWYLRLQSLFLILSAKALWLSHSHHFAAGMKTTSEES